MTELRATRDELAAVLHSTEPMVRRALALFGLATDAGHPTVAARELGVVSREVRDNTVDYLWDVLEVGGVLAHTLDTASQTQDEAEKVLLSLRSHPAPVAMQRPVFDDEF